MNSGSLLGVSVLVVDDEPDVRDLAQVILGRARCDVVTAEDGIDALEKIAHGFEPLVIFLDGEGVLRALAKRPINGVRVIRLCLHSTKVH